MNIGMMWVDTDAKATLDEKIQRASDYYREKYGRFPELCFVSKQQELDEDHKVGRVQVKLASQLQPNYFWLGMQAPA